MKDLVLSRLDRGKADRLRATWKGPVSGKTIVGDLMGRMLDTYGILQVGAEIRAIDPQLRACHLRLEGERHGVDLPLETPDGRLVAIEVKADAAPTPGSARHLRWLKDELGDRCVAGTVLHTGPRPYVFGDRHLALPICCLWA